jgi:hypothetical protein
MVCSSGKRNKPWVTHNSQIENPVNPTNPAFAFSAERSFNRVIQRRSIVQSAERKKRDSGELTHVLQDMELRRKSTMNYTKRKTEGVPYAEGNTLGQSKQGKEKECT